MYKTDYRTTSTLDNKCHTVQDVHDYLKETYCKSTAAEFKHISDEEERLWCFENFERITHEPVSKEEKIKALQLLVRTEMMEAFMQKKFATHKRYSSEGSEAITVALNTLIAEASDSERERTLDSVILAMPHRGRLASLVILNEYPFRNLLYKAAGKNDVPEELVDRIDDIPTHIAVSNSKRFQSGRPDSNAQKVTMTMIHNPSHLESQNAISMGKARAKMDDYSEDQKHQVVMNVQCHGDSAFPGQGASYEALGLSKLPNFSCGGTVHIITNNQVGFTTEPTNYRSFQNSSDLVKPFEVPILRINTADVDAVIRACRFAVEYWSKYGKDVMLDMIGYRYYGHNEVDEPSFTQPVMYKKIREMVTPPKSFQAKLIAEGLITEAEVTQLREQIEGHFEQEFQKSLTLVPELKNTTDPKYRGSRSLTHKWAGMKFSQMGTDPTQTGFDQAKLVEIAKSTIDLPSDFAVHPRLAKMHMNTRMKTIDKQRFDWATAEAAAFGSLLLDGYNVRLVGEDSERGTFSQRHAVFTDQTDCSSFRPLLSSPYMRDNSVGRYQCFNTNLSELATMAYEYGYSMENPKNLVLWEAQFGDFYNPAQLVVDQYLMCSEAKWLRQTGLVLLLPHGFDGAGPEHSTCHMERFLQNVNSQAYDTVSGQFDNLNAQNINFQVAQCTTSSNYFHILRRQMLRDFRKPLVIAAPKIGLKHPKAVSGVDEFAPETRFRPTITQDFYDASNIRKLVICSGKVAFDIEDALNKKSGGAAHGVRVIRLEEIAPFPVNDLRSQMSGLSRDTDVVYVQEESMNQGAFQWAKLHVDRILAEQGFSQDKMAYVGRSSVHSFCTGAGSDYKAQVDKLWADFDSAVHQ